MVDREGLRRLSGPGRLPALLDTLVPSTDRLRAAHQVRRPGPFAGGGARPRPRARLAHRQGHHGMAPRRPVPSPAPKGRRGDGHRPRRAERRRLVVCAGGGGVPVTADHDTGVLTGVEAVVDKDFTAVSLLILTDVPNVYADFGTPRQQPVLYVAPQLRDRAFPREFDAAQDRGRCPVRGMDRWPGRYRSPRRRVRHRPGNIDDVRTTRTPHRMASSRRRTGESDSGTVGSWPGASGLCCRRRMGPRLEAD